MSNTENAGAAKLPVLDKGYVRLVDQLGDDRTVVNNARVSYDKESAVFSDGDQRLLNFLLKNGHTSPFRHAVMQFEVYAPLLTARQWFKYSVASAHWDDQHAWNESSRRYVTEDTEYYTPRQNEWRGAPENKKQGSGAMLSEGEGLFLTERLRQHQRQATELYEQAIADGVATEQARLFLPAYGLYVRWRWTISLSGVLHFLDERLDAHAQWEIQQYAQAVDKHVRSAYPGCYEAYETSKDD